MLLEKRGKVIGLGALHADIRIHAAGAHRCTKHVPHGNTAVGERAATTLVLPISTLQIFHDAPERVLRMGVVLLRIERALAREAAEYENSRPIARNGRKTH